MLMVSTRIIDSEPALILDGDKKNLVISDLHIGFEHKFSSNKNTIGKNSSINEIISNIKKIIKRENPDTLILLGDVKSSIQNITKTEWRDIPYFFEEIKNTSILINKRKNALNFGIETFSLTKISEKWYNAIVK